MKFFIGLHSLKILPVPAITYSRDNFPSPKLEARFQPNLPGDVRREINQIQFRRCNHSPFAVHLLVGRNGIT
jgi:hypothetical protein